MKYKNNNQHVLPKDNGWAVKKAGANKNTKVFSKQSDAIKYAKDIAKNHKSELFIHSKTGRIRERNTYNKDKCPPRG